MFPSIQRIAPLNRTVKVIQMLLLPCFVFSVIFSLLEAASFTVCSYNCGGVDHHYDFYREVAIQKLLQQRYNEEPEKMALFEKIENAALQILFYENPIEYAYAVKEWEDFQYGITLHSLICNPEKDSSCNRRWALAMEKTLSHYQEVPVILYDCERESLLRSILKDIIYGQNLKIDIDNERISALEIARGIIANRAFKYELKYDIFCLQEANNITADMFPDTYEMRLAHANKRPLGIAWNKKRFELVEEIPSAIHRALLLLLRDRQTQKTVLIASAHLHGCNPFHCDANSAIGKCDSFLGDGELREVLCQMEGLDADIKIVGMDANVTATHPRLRQLKEAHYKVDAQKFLEPTCTNPYYILNTRIDWIAANSLDQALKIDNIPIYGIGLNSIQTNFSDHKPIAAKISYSLSSIPE